MIHTKRPLTEVNNHKIPLTEVNNHKIPQGRLLPWADVKTAYRDLKRVGRNIVMVDENFNKQGDQRINGIGITKCCSIIH